MKLSEITDKNVELGISSYNVYELAEYVNPNVGWDTINWFETKEDAIKAAQKEKGIVAVWEHQMDEGDFAIDGYYNIISEVIYTTEKEDEQCITKE